MRAIRLHGGGGSESLICEDTPIPEPRDGQVLIRVHAAAVTPTEFAWYPTFHTPEGNARPFPIILGHEFSGVVAAMGGSNRDARVGDSVYGLNDWFMDGAQAEYCLVAAASVAPKPATVDHTLAAAVPISALTAWQALVDRAQLSEGQRILIHGGAGGVGSVAVQLARHKKAHVIVTASAANMDFMIGLGADEVIDYRTTPFETVVRDVDVVLDTVGGETRDRSWRVLRKGGQLVTIAADAEG
jgi:NADPH:quinone reductase-like Zn-dependent oxidoreductase